jgi:hypothetical protein
MTNSQLIRVNIIVNSYYYKSSIKNKNIFKYLNIIYSIIFLIFLFTLLNYLLIFFFTVLTA